MKNSVINIIPRYNLAEHYLRVLFTESDWASTRAPELRMALPLMSNSLSFLLYARHPEEREGLCSSNDGLTKLDK